MASNIHIIIIIVIIIMAIMMTPRAQRDANMSHCHRRTVVATFTTAILIIIMITNTATSNEEEKEDATIEATLHHHLQQINPIEANILFTMVKTRNKKYKNSNIVSTMVVAIGHPIITIIKGTSSTKGGHEEDAIAG